MHNTTEGPALPVVAKSGSAQQAALQEPRTIDLQPGAPPLAVQKQVRGSGAWGRQAWGDHPRLLLVTHRSPSPTKNSGEGWGQPSHPLISPTGHRHPPPNQTPQRFVVEAAAAEFVVREMKFETFLSLQEYF